MLRSFGLALLLLVPIADPAWGQFGPTGQNPAFRPGSNANVLNTRISGQGISRQVEIDRLESMLRGFEDRVVMMERQLLQMSRLPAITIEEAEAAVAFAEAQLKETEYQLEQGKASDLAVKRHRLDLVRAKGQLKTAKASHEESLILAELELAYANRAYLRESNEQEQLKRFVAKGYTSSDAVKYSLFDVDLAEKRLKLARLRLDVQRNSMTTGSGSSSLSKEVESILDSEAASTSEQ